MNKADQIPSLIFLFFSKSLIQVLEIANMKDPLATFESVPTFR